MHVGFPSALLIAAALLAASSSHADVPLPPGVLNPASVAEAWNVIRLSTANAARLLQENRLLEITEQISLCSPSLRLLARSPVAPGQKKSVDEKTALAFRHVNSIAQASMAQSRPDAEKMFADLQTTLRDIGQAFDPKVVTGEIYHCRTHTDIVTEREDMRCKLCDEPLIVRRIPYSFIYVQPAQPTLKLSVLTGAPLIAGTKADVKIQLQTVAGAPVTIPGLLVTHTHPVHLFITDPLLAGFHHVQPAATATPGEYAFSFTPATSGPHRLWADVVPVSSGLQELLSADLGGEFKKGVPSRATDNRSGAAGGLRFELSLVKSVGGQLHARRIQFLRLTVTDAAGQPFTRLEPLMNAFAHLTGFYADHQTVLRLHPVGGDILRDDLRGGPTLGFKFYPPKTGFIRFHCEAKVDGKTLVAPLGVHVVE